MNTQSKVYIAGHRGLVGSALLRKLQADGYTNLIVRTHQELELTDQQAVNCFFAEEKPEFVLLAAARVGGIHANDTYSAEFIYQNIQIQTNVIHAAYTQKVKKLLFLGSTCIYPKHCPQPMKEEYLLTGPLEPTNEAYAIAKISGIKMCQFYNKQYGTDFISVMPTNLYGPNDNYDLNNSHVLPALIRKFHEAKVAGQESVVVWGSGTPTREFLHVDDCAHACIYLMKNYTGSEIINIGSGQDISIKELAMLIKDSVGYTGEVIFDTTKPDGMPKKSSDTSRLNALGWRPKIKLEEGIRMVYEDYKLNH